MMFRINSTILLVLFLLGISGCSTEEEKVVILNKIVDSLLKIAVKGVKEDGKDQFVVPDMNTDFHSGWSFLSVNGSFKGRGGWLKSLSTLKRTGNATLFTDDTGMLLEASLGLRTLEFGFEHYEAKFGVFSVSGECRSSVGNNSMTLKILLIHDEETCRAELQEVKVDYIDSIKVVLTGMWKFNSLYSKIVTWFTNRSKSKIIDGINENAFIAIQSALRKYEVCSKLMDLF